eukprot:929356-Prymnesium_polylepis.3
MCQVSRSDGLVHAARGASESVASPDMAVGSPGSGFEKKSDLDPRIGPHRSKTRNWPTLNM